MKKIFLSFLLGMGMLSWTGCQEESAEQQMKNVTDAPADFAQVKNGELILKGKPFRFSATNSYRLLESWVDVDRYFKTLKDLKINVVRMWGFANAEAPQSRQNILIYNPQPGVWPPRLEYPEDTWKRFDYVLKKAKDHGIYIILPLANYWDEFGSIAMLNGWAGLPPEVERHKDREIFYTHPRAREVYTMIVSKTLNRVNHLTGVAYKNDPTILFWEPMNEPRGRSDVSGKKTADWIDWAAGLIKKLDTNHLVGSGTEGFFAEYRPSPGLAPSYSFMQYPFQSKKPNRVERLNPENSQKETATTLPEGIYFEQECALPNIDLCSIHAWPYNWFSDGTPAGIKAFGKYWVLAHIDEMKRRGISKPLYIGEFGRQIVRRDAQGMMVRNSFVEGIYEAALNGSVAGAGLWYVSHTGAESWDRLAFDILCDPSITYDSTCSLIKDFGTKIHAAP
jgi:mannan endo-1,4-beta-mannosidase